MRVRSARSVSISLHRAHSDPADQDQDTITSNEYEINWRSVVFVPFGGFWKFVLNTSIVANSFWVIFFLAYHHTHSGEESSEWFHYAMEIFYLLDTLLLIAHRNMSRFRKIRDYDPKSIISIILDIATLLPINEVYYLLLYVSGREKSMNIFFRKAVRIKSALRLYRTSQYSTRMKSQAGRDQILIIGLSHFVTSALIIHVLAAIWYNMGCYKCDYENWASSMEDTHVFDPSSVFQWFIICYTNIGIAFQHCYKGVLPPLVWCETIVLIITMLVGFFNHMVYFFGQLTIGRIKQFRRQQEYSRRIKQVKLALDDWDIKKEIRDRTMQYYSTLWYKRSGIKDMPKCFNLLPSPMQKEVTVDIFWEALRHSSLFSTADLPFKRAISLAMKSEFYLPGDYVFKTDHYKTKMIYVVSGIIQIISDEDEESAVLSFSAGTVLGETSLVYPTKSNTNVRCATICELHTLSMSELGRALCGFSKGIHQMKNILQDRIEFAKYLLSVKEAKALEKDDSEFASTDDNSILWMKARWRQLYEIKRRKKPVDLEKLRTLTDIQHTSMNLGLLTLSGDVELKIKAICLNADCPYIFEPDSTFRIFCDYIVLLAVAVQSLLLPYFISFERRIPSAVNAILFIFDCVYFFDIYLQLSTAIKGRVHTITTVSAIILYKFKEMSFLLDVFSVLPYSYVAVAFGVSEHAEALLKTNRMLKVHKLVAFMKRKEKDFTKSALSIQLAKYAVLYIYVLYWCNCLFYSIACFYKECYEHGWFKINLAYFVNMGYVDDPNEHIFIRCFLYTINVIFAMKQCTIIEWVTHEKLIMFLVLNLAYYLYSFCFSVLCATMVINNQPRLNYKDYIRSMNAYMIKNQVNANLRKRVADLLIFRWEYNENVIISGENGIMDDAPTYIRDRVVLKRIMKGLYNAPLFRDCEQDFVHSVAAQAILNILPENGVVTKADIKSTWIHVILRGYCNLKSHMAGDQEKDSITVLKPGDAFPVLETLNQVLVLTDVVAVTAVELISIKLSNLNDSLSRFPHVQRQFSTALFAHRSQFETQLTRKKGRLPEMIPLKKSLGQGELFKYDIYDAQETAREVREYINPFAALGKLSIVKYALLRRTINPKGRFFISWEIFKLSLSASLTIIAIGHNTIFVTKYDELIIFFRVADLIMLIDLYIRMHCQYYKDNGILVRHPWTTLKHYVSTSFTIDFLSYCPTNYLGLNHMLGNENVQYVGVFLRMVGRPLQMHRFFGLLTYHQSNIKNHRSGTIQTIKYSVLVLLAVGVSSVMLVNYVCRVTADDQIVCQEDKWLTHVTLYGKNLTPPLVFLLSLTLPFYFFSLTGAIFMLTDIDEIIFCMPFVFLLYLLRWYFIAKLTSHNIGGNLNLTIFHEQVENFQQFMEKELIDESLVALTIENYQYVWKKTQGTEVSESLRSFHPHLHEELGLELYCRTLERAEFFYEADVSFFRLMSVQIREMYFKKDAEIIRCNDVQGMVYIVAKGKVDISVAKIRLSTLGSGGMFGTFKGKGKIRQTITATAKVHCCVLAVDGAEFFKIVVQYPEVLMKVNQANFLNAEYVEERGNRGSAYDNASVGSMSSVYSAGSAFSSMSTRSAFRKLTFFGLLIREHGKRYRIFNYLVCVHLATWSSLWFSFVVVMVPLEDDYSTTATLAIACVVDLLFIAKMFVASHLTYVDAESGILVTDTKLIRKRYFCSLLRFWFDLFTTIPINLIVMFVCEEYIRFAYINRIFRWLYLVMYYAQEERDLKLKRHLRWTYLIYTMILNIQAMACVWFLVACNKNYRCYYNTKFLDTTTVELVEAKSWEDSILLAYTFIVKTLTTNELKTLVPANPVQLMTSIIITVFLLYATIKLVSGFTTMMSISNYSMGNYEHNIDGLRIYLQDRDLSPFILNYVWKYCLQLWYRQRGEWMPSLVAQAPSYIKQDIMLSLYGFHIETHFLFTRTHIDFVRQLVVHLKRCVFFPGNYLAEKGDVDSCMYFIHDGEVDVFDVHGENVIPREVLRKGKSFGEASGLFNTQHMYSYKAHTVVDALSLKYSDWEYLLKWFPASKEEIFEKARQFHVKRGPKIL